MSRVVVALGGNALSRRGEAISVDVMRARLAEVASELASAFGEDELVVTHGNGPQIGQLAMQSELGGLPSPLDVLGAESQGMIGFLVEEALAPRMNGRDVVVLLTQVVVDRSDPAFAQPTKPIGPVYSEADARRIADERGWIMGPDGNGVRRLVASPEPRSIRELGAIAHLVGRGFVVVCGGGGGIPVTVDEVGVRGVPAAVIDKDLTTALLARSIRADALVLLTDVDGVYDRWPDGVLLRRTMPGELRARRFAPGSMQPKVDAACRFVEQSGRRAFIGRLGALADLLAGRSGTCVATT